MKHFFKYFVAIVILAGACDDADESVPADIGLDYFPLQTGNYYIYNIEETIFSEVAPVQNLISQMKVEVVDSFPTPEGIYTYVLSRMTRDDENAVWQDLDTWSTRGNDREMIVNEGNVPYLKLTFPVRQGKTWNGNKYNNYGEDEYELTALGGSMEVNGTSFANTLTVTQELNDDIIVFQDIRKEVYAKGIGLIYKETAQLNYCTDDNCLGQQIIESGTIYIQELAQYVVR